jgi:hypothetical protein
MKLEIALCNAAGINTRNLQPWDVFQIGGKIIHSRTLWPYLEKYIVGGILPEDARFKAMKEMKPEALAKFREEVTSGILR